MIIFVVDSQLNAKIADLELGVNKKEGGTADDGFYRNYENGLEYCMSCLTRTCGVNCSCCNYTNNDDNNNGRRSLSGYGTSTRSSGIMVDNFQSFLANWAAPEFIAVGKYTQASDIYSLGLVLWEVFSEQVPYGDITSQELIRKQVRVVERVCIGCMWFV